MPFEVSFVEEESDHYFVIHIDMEGFHFKIEFPSPCRFRKFVWVRLCNYIRDQISGGYHLTADRNNTKIVLGVSEHYLFISKIPVDPNNSAIEIKLPVDVKYAEAFERIIENPILQRYWV